MSDLIKATLEDAEELVNTQLDRTDGVANPATGRKFFLFKSADDLAAFRADLEQHVMTAKAVISAFEKSADLTVPQVNALNALASALDLAPVFKTADPLAEPVAEAAADAPAEPVEKANDAVDEVADADPTEDDAVEPVEKADESADEAPAEVAEAAAVPAEPVDLVAAVQKAQEPLVGALAELVELLKAQPIQKSAPASKQPKPTTSTRGAELKYGEGLFESAVF